jgi:hypothetical protein
MADLPSLGSDQPPQGGDDGPCRFVLADYRGGKALVTAAKVAYVELGGNEPRRAGFSNLWPRTGPTRRTRFARASATEPHATA